MVISPFGPRIELLGIVASGIVGIDLIVVFRVTFDFSIIFNN